MTYSFPPRRYSDRTDGFFFAHRGGRGADGELADALALYRPVGGDDDYWQDETPQTMLIDEVEAIWRSEEHTSELQSLMRISYAVFCLKKKKKKNKTTT